MIISEFCPSNNSRPVLMLIVIQKKRLGVNIWPNNRSYYTYKLAQTQWDIWYIMGRNEEEIFLFI